MPIFAQMTESISTIPATPTLANLSLAAVNPVVTNLLIGLFLVVSIVMILLVLIQRPQGGGLSGAFGSGGGGAGGAGQTAFGTKTGDVLTWATIGIFVAFVGFAIVLNFATRPTDPADIPVRMVAPAGSAPADEADAAEAAQNQLDELDAQSIEEDAQENTPSDAGDAPAGADLPVGDE